MALFLDDFESLREFFRLLSAVEVLGGSDTTGFVTKSTELLNLVIQASNLS